MEKYLIDHIVLNAHAYDKYGDLSALEKSHSLVERLQELKGFETFTEAFEYFENQL